MKFSYEGHTRSGVAKKGTIEADSEEEASAKLRKKDIFVMSMKPEGEEHRMVLEHGKVPEEDDDHLLDLDSPGQSGQSETEPLEDELRPEYNLDELKRVPEEKRHRPKEPKIMDGESEGEYLARRRKWVTACTKASRIEKEAKEAEKPKTEGEDKRWEPFELEDNVGLKDIRDAMRVAGISWDSGSGQWLFRRITFDKDGEQISEWLPAMAWMAHRLEDARASYQLSQIIKAATERAGKATLE